MILECIDCGNTPIEANERCASCNTRIRKEAKQAAKDALKKPSTIRKVSPQKQAKLKDYSQLRKEYLKENPVCELHLISCTGLATEIHHCSTSEKDFLNTKTWKSACRTDHDFIERVMSAAERRKRGFLI